MSVSAPAAGATAGVNPPRWRGLRRPFAFIVFGHLLLAAGFALDMSDAGFMARLPRSLHPLVRLYGSVTGGTGGYGFFSPDISPQVSARFEMVDAAGARRAVQLGLENRELAIRIGNITDSQWDLRPGKEALEINRSLASSYAGKIFAGEPRARSVDVIVEYYDIPRMEAYRAGARPAWKPYYRATFHHDSTPAVKQP
jgi:hypothetical protein